MEKTAAGEFMEVYKDVLPEFTDVINDLSSGTVLVLAIKGTDLVV